MAPPPEPEVERWPSHAWDVAASTDPAIGPRQVLLIALCFAFVVLALTGAWLTLYYRPSSALAWSNVPGRHHPQVVRVVHRWASRWVTFLSLGLLLTTVIERLTARRGERTRPVVRQWVGGALLPIVAVGFAASGYALAWDQLALWAVTVGRNMSGIRPVLFDPAVKFVLLRHVEISQASYRWMALAHLFALPAAFGVVAFLARGGSRRSA